MPKPRMINPDIRFTQTIAVVVDFVLTRLTVVLRMNHQQAEPRNTPNTMRAADEYPLLVSTKPRPAKIAAKAMMVSGLVSVRKKEDPYAVNKPN